MRHSKQELLLIILLDNLTNGGKIEVSLSEVSELMGISHTQLTDLLKQFENEGLVRSNGVKCTLTSKGTDFLKHLLLFEKKSHWEALKKEKTLAVLRSRVEKNKERIQKMIDQSRIVTKNSDEWDNLFLVARKWNSYTPTLPYASEDLKWGEGGGYLLIWNGKALAIDPGFNFLKILNRHFSLGIKDIDGVILTHDHPDHTAGVEEIFTLLYELNKKGNHRTLDFFGNLSTIYKFNYNASQLLDYLNIYTLRPGVSLNMEKDYDMTIHVKKAYHTETGGKRNYAVGLVFELKDSFKLGLTSDTMWKTDLIAEYAGVNMLIAHLGSLEVEDKSLENHLGSMGCFLLLKYISPQLALISEFGEELEGSREELVRFLSKSTDCKIIPADVGLRIKLPSMEIFCSKCKAYHHADEIVYTEVRGQIIYECKGQKTIS